MLKKDNIIASVTNKIFLRASEMTYQSSAVVSLVESIIKLRLKSLSENSYT